MSSIAMILRAEHEFAKHVFGVENVGRYSEYYCKFNQRPGTLLDSIRNNEDFFDIFQGASANLNQTGVLCVNVLMLIRGGRILSTVEEILRASQHQYRSCENMPQVRAALASESFDLAIVDMVFSRNYASEIANLIPDDLPMLVIVEHGMAMPDVHVYWTRSGRVRIIHGDTGLKETRNLIKDFIKRIDHEKIPR